MGVSRNQLKYAFIFVIGLFLVACAEETPTPVSEPRRISSDNFTIVTKTSFDAEALLVDLEHLRLAALQDWGIINPPDEIKPITLTLIQDEDVYFGIAPRSQPEGYYVHSAIGDNIVIFDSPSLWRASELYVSTDTIRHITRHETVHALVSRYIPAAMPIWAGEGLAEYYSKFKWSEDGTVRFGSLNDTGSPYRWPDMPIIFSSYGGYPDFSTQTYVEQYESTVQFYFLSHALIHLILEKPEGIHGIHDWHDKISNGQSLEEATTTLISANDDTLWEQAADKVETGKPTIRISKNIPSIDTTLFETNTLTGSEHSAHLRRLVRMHRPLQAGARAPVYGNLMNARSNEADYYLARAFEAINMGQVDQSRRHLIEGLKRAPSSPDALFIQAMIAFADVERYGSEDRFVETATDTFEAARDVAYDPILLYAMRLYQLRKLPHREWRNDDTIHTLDWLQTNNLHCQAPYLAENFISTYLNSNREDYARKLFFSAMHYTTTGRQKRDLWYKYAVHLGLKQSDWDRAFPDVEPITP
jgi:hypothetical protein